MEVLLLAAAAWDRGDDAEEVRVLRNVPLLGEELRYLQAVSHCPVSGRVTGEGGHIAARMPYTRITQK